MTVILIIFRSQMTINICITKTVFLILKVVSLTITLKALYHMIYELKK